MINKKLLITLLVLIIASLVGCGGGGGQTSVAPNTGGTSNKTGGAPVPAVLSWDAPTTRVDSSPLNPAIDLQSYTIYYGTAPGVYTHSLSVSNPGTSTITHTFSLVPDTYYFTVTATDNYGQESGPTAEISKTF
jgi:hypothetical protein